MAVYVVVSLALKRFADLHRIYIYIYSNHETQVHAASGSRPSCMQSILWPKILWSRIMDTGVAPGVCSRCFFAHNGELEDTCRKCSASLVAPAAITPQPTRKLKRHDSHDESPPKKALDKKSCAKKSNETLHTDKPIAVDNAQLVLTMGLMHKFMKRLHFKTRRLFRRVLRACCYVHCMCVQH